jgi:hypothetical protein
LKKRNVIGYYLNEMPVRAILVGLCWLRQVEYTTGGAFSYFQQEGLRFIEPESVQTASADRCFLLPSPRNWTLEP